MDRTAVFVDAGYVFAAGSKLIAGEKLPRELNVEEMEAVLKESVGGSVPAEIDRRLLVAGSQALDGTQLTPAQKRRVRAAFLDACRKLVKQ